MNEEVNTLEENIHFTVALKYKFLFLWKSTNKSNRRNICLWHKQKITLKKKDSVKELYRNDRKGNKNQR